MADALTFKFFLTLGSIVIFSILVRSFCQRIKMPPLVFFLLLGIGINYIEIHTSGFPLLGHEGRNLMEFFAKLGLFALLFRAGLESNPTKLKKEFGVAGIIWVGNFLASGLAGFAAAYWFLGVSIIPSLIIGSALTATSIAVSVALWEDAGAMQKDEASAMLDVAEMDDISGVALLALLLALIPLMLQNGLSEELLSSGVRVLGWFLFKLLVFVSGCILFARYAEAHMTELFRKLTPGIPHLMLLVLGISVIVAGLGEWLGFSLAVGALFAGLVFSSDKNRKKIKDTFQPLYLLLAPFFFIGIGLSIEPSLLVISLQAGLVLLTAAILGKLAGGTLPARLHFSWMGAAAIGISLIPRAEITLLIAERAHQMGPDVLPSEYLAALALVTVATCLLSPFLLQGVISKLK